MNAYLNDPLFLVNWACRKHTGVELPSHYSSNYPNQNEWSYKVQEVKCFGKNPNGDFKPKKIAIRDKNSLLLEFVDRPMMSVEPNNGFAENIFKTNLINEMKTIFNWKKNNTHYRIQHLLAPVVKGIKSYMDEKNILEDLRDGTTLDYIDEVYDVLYINPDSSWYMDIPMEYILFLEKKVYQYYTTSVHCRTLKTTRITNIHTGVSNKYWVKGSNCVYPVNIHTIWGNKRNFLQQCRGYHRIRDGEPLCDLSKKEYTYEDFTTLRNWLVPILMDTAFTPAGKFWMDIIKTEGVRKVQDKPPRFGHIQRKIMVDESEFDWGVLMDRRKIKSRHKGNQIGGTIGDFTYHNKKEGYRNNYWILPEKGKALGGLSGQNNKYEHDKLTKVNRGDLATQHGWGNVKVARKYWYPFFIAIVGDSQRDCLDTDNLGYDLRRAGVRERKDYWKYILTVSPLLNSQTHYGYKSWIKEREEDWANRGYQKRFIKEILQKHKVVEL